MNKIKQYVLLHLNHDRTSKFNILEDFNEKMRCNSIIGFKTWLLLLPSSISVGSTDITVERSIGSMVRVL